jgi:hypothetical protein
MSKITIGHLTTLLLTLLAFSTSLKINTDPATILTSATTLAPANNLTPATTEVPNQNTLAPQEKDPAAAAAAGVFGSPGFLNTNNVFSASLVNSSSQSSTGDSNVNMLVSSNSDKNTVKVNGDLNGSGGNIISNSVGNFLLNNTTTMRKSARKNFFGCS